jgi:large subunit ribosomal protein L23
MPARFATFIVPLNLNKLDIKDYLYHAYNIQTRSIRSFVQQSKVRQDKPGAKIPKQKRWYRPRAIKKMTVEMTKPFVWPEVPEDLSPWDKKRFDAVKKLQEEDKDSRSPNAVLKPSTERTSIAEQARRLLEGKDQWKSNWAADTPSTL